MFTVQGDKKNCYGIQSNGDNQPKSAKQIKVQTKYKIQWEICAFFVGFCLVEYN